MHYYPRNESPALFNVHGDKDVLAVTNLPASRPETVRLKYRLLSSRCDTLGFRYEYFVAVALD